VRKLCLILLLAFTAHCLQAQSVADAARAARERQQSPTARKVITDEDLPPSTDSAANGAAISLGPEWDADIERFRSAYKQICSAAGSRTSLTAKEKQLLEQASQPLKTRMEQEQIQMKQLKADLQLLKNNEDVELAAAGADQGRVSVIRSRYAALRKEKQAIIATSLQRAVKVFNEVMTVASDCLKQ
jgi:hypothetical protein